MSDGALTAASLAVEFIADYSNLDQFATGGFQALLNRFTEKGGVLIPIGINQAQVNAEANKAHKTADDIFKKPLDINVSFTGARDKARQLRQDVQREFEASGKTTPMQVNLVANTAQLLNQIQTDLNTRTFTIQVQAQVNSQMIGGMGANMGPTGGFAGGSSSFTSPGGAGYSVAYPPDINSAFGRRSGAGFNNPQRRGANGQFLPLTDEDNAIRARWNTPSSPVDYGNASASAASRFLYGSNANNGALNRLAAARSQRDQRIEANAKISAQRQLAMDFQGSPDSSGQMGLFGSTAENAQFQNSAGPRRDLLNPSFITRGQAVTQNNINRQAAGLDPVTQNGALSVAQTPATGMFAGSSIPQMQLPGSLPGSPSQNYRAPASALFRRQAQVTGGFTNLTDPNSIAQAKMTSAADDIRGMFSNGVMPSLRGFTERFQKNWQEGLQKTEGEARRHMFAGMMLTASFTYPATRIAKAGISELTDFESANAKTAALTEVTPTQIKAIRSEIIGLSKDMPQTAKELSEGFYFIASNGLKGADSMAVLRASAKGAAGGLGETKDIADTTTSVLAAYDLEASKASKVVDILTQAVKVGKGEASEYAGAFAKVIPIASQAGISFEEVAASMSIMTRVGLKPNEAATAFRQLASNLYSPSAEARSAMKSLNTDPNKIRASIRTEGLAATLQDLMKASGGNIDILDKLVGNIRGLTGLLATAGSQSKAYSQALGEMKNSAGATDKAFGVMSGTLEFQWARMLNSGKSVFLEIGQRLLPQLTGHISEFANTVPGYMDTVVAAWNGLPPSLKTVVEGITAFLLLAGPMMMMVGTLKNVQAALMLFGAAGAANPVLVMAGLAVGALLLGQRLDTTKGIMSSFTGTMNDSGKGLSSIISPLNAVLAILVAMQAIKLGNNLYGGFNNLSIAMKGALSNARSLSASMTQFVQAKGIVGGSANALAMGRPTGFIGPLTSTGTTLSPSQLANKGVMSTLMTGIGPAFAATAASAAALTAAVMLGAAAWENYKQRITDAEVASYNLKVANDGLKKSVANVNSLVPEFGSVSSPARRRMNNIADEFATSQDDLPRLKQLSGSAEKLLSDIKINPNMGEAERQVLERQVREFLTKIDATIEVKMEIENAPGPIQQMQDNITGAYKDSDFLKVASVPVAQTVQDFRNVVNLGKKITGPISDFATGYGQANPNIVSADGMSSKPGMILPENKPKPYDAVKGFIGPIALADNPVGVALDNLLGGKQFSKLNDEKIANGIKQFKDFDKLNKAWTALQQQSPDARQNKLGSDNRPNIPTNLLSSIWARNQELKQKKNKDDENARKANDRDIAAETESNRIKNQDRQTQISKESSMWNSYSGVLDGVIGKIREYAMKTEAARVNNELMKRSFDGISDSARATALELAHVYDNMKALTDLKDVNRDIVGGMQRELIGAGIVTNPLGRDIQRIGQIFPYQNAMNAQRDRGMSAYTRQALGVENRISALHSQSAAISARGDAPVVGNWTNGQGNGNMLSTARSMLGIGMTDPRIMATGPGVFGKKDGDEWCVGFVQAVRQNSGLQKLAGGTLSVNALRAWGKKEGRVTNDPKPGDVLTRVVGGERHAAIVATRNGNRVTTIGGNEGNRNNFKSRVKEGNGYDINGPGMLFLSSDNQSASPVSNEQRRPALIAKGDSEQNWMNLINQAQFNGDGSPKNLAARQANAMYDRLHGGTGKLSGSNDQRRPALIGNMTGTQKRARQISVAGSPVSQHFNNASDQLSPYTSLGYGIDAVRPGEGFGQRMALQEKLQTKDILEKIEKGFQPIPGVARAAGQSIEEYIRVLWRMAETTDRALAGQRAINSSLGSIPNLRSAGRMIGKEGDQFAQMEEGFRQENQVGYTDSALKQRKSESAQAYKTRLRNVQRAQLGSNMVSGYRVTGEREGANFAFRSAMERTAMAMTNADPLSGVAADRYRATRTAEIGIWTDPKFLADQKKAPKQLNAYARGVVARAGEEFDLNRAKEIEDARYARQATNSLSLSDSHTRRFQMNNGLMPDSAAYKAEVEKDKIRQSIFQDRSIPKADREGAVTEALKSFTQNLDVEQAEAFKTATGEIADSMRTLADDTGLAAKSLAMYRNFINAGDATKVNVATIKQWGAGQTNALDADYELMGAKSETQRARITNRRRLSAFAPGQERDAFAAQIPGIIAGTGRNEVAGIAKGKADDARDQLRNLQQEAGMAQARNNIERQRVQWHAEDLKTQEKLKEIGIEETDSQKAATNVLRQKVEEQMKFNQWQSDFQNMADNMSQSFVGVFKNSDGTIKGIIGGIFGSIKDQFMDTVIKDGANYLTHAILGKDYDPETNTLQKIFSKPKEPKNSPKQDDEGFVVGILDTLKIGPRAKSRPVGDLPGSVMNPTGPDSQVARDAKVGVLDKILGSKGGAATMTADGLTIYAASVNLVNGAAGAGGVAAAGKVGGMSDLQKYSGLAQSILGAAGSLG